MPQQPEDLLNGSIKLTSLPEVCVRVNEMVDDPHSSAADIGEVISRDPALTAQLLRIANSSFFNFPSKIATVSRAITIIGERELRYLVLAMSAIRSFSDVPLDTINMATFWRHSVYTGVMARLLAKRCRVLHSERLFVTGLLHEVGLLLLLTGEAEREANAMSVSGERGIALSVAEEQEFGFNHADVGRALLTSWNLPPELCEAVGCAHDIEGATLAPLDVAIVHVADILANQAEMSSDCSGVCVDYGEGVWDMLGLDPSITAELTEQAEPLFAESWALIQPMVRHAR